MLSVRSGLCFRKLAYCCRLGDDRKGKNQRQGGRREGAAAIWVRDAGGPHRGGGRGDKWTDARAV